MNLPRTWSGASAGSQPEIPDQVRDTMRIYEQLSVIWHKPVMTYFVYMMASRPGGAIYIGRTRDLHARVQQHRDGFSQHTAKYKIKTLVWFEAHHDFETSLARERSIKRWRRAWKNQLIHTANPHWQDITAHIPF